jgi:VanZ family protein
MLEAVPHYGSSRLRMTKYVSREKSRDSLKLFSCGGLFSRCMDQQAELLAACCRRTGRLLRRFLTVRSAPSFIPAPLRPGRYGWLAVLSVWLPVFFFLVLLAVESSPALGSDHTSRPLHAALHALAGSSVDHNWTLLHHLVRKAGHFTGYGMLCMVLLRGLRLTSRSRKSWPLRVPELASLAATFLIAGLDEWHQTFLPNRSGRFSDVLLDTAGAATLLLAGYLLERAMGILRTAWLRPAALGFIRMRSTCRIATEPAGNVPRHTEQLPATA